MRETLRKLRFSAALMAACLFIACLSYAEAKDLRIKRETDNYLVEAVVNQNPPIIGKNDARAFIADAAGKSFPGPSVTVNYFMPPCREWRQ